MNRVFASKKEGFCLYKKRHDDGLVRFADAPLNMHLWNDDCAEIADFNNIVDFNHYYQLVMKRLERWILNTCVQGIYRKRKISEKRCGNIRLT